MLEVILGILGSGTVGSIVGLVGGLLNRKVDLQAKQMELEDRREERSHDLLRMDKEKDYMLAEAGKKVEVAVIEADARVEEAGYAAMAESYEFAAPTRADGLVYKISAAIRPLLTVAFLIFTVYVFYTVNDFMVSAGINPEPKDIVRVWTLCIEWALFQTGVCVGWWFAMRPGKMPDFFK